ncbi:MAG: molybdopterin-dependent oxidoreductase [Pseudomonadales bacterium]
MSQEITSHYRACHLCEAICGVEIKTQGEQILSIKGDKLDPFSRGHICPKATALQDLHEDPDRLRTPVRRQGDQWIPIEWDEAFDIVAQKLHSIQQQYGQDAAAAYLGNPNVHNYGSLTHGGPLLKMLKTRNIYSASTLDQRPHELISYLMYGHQHLSPVPDIDRTRFMLILGANPLASNGSMMTVPDVTKRLKSIQKRGGRFVVIDPRRSETAAIADEHHFIRPGTDAFLLLAMIHSLFEQELVNVGELASVVGDLNVLRDSLAVFTPELAASETGIDAETIRSLALEMAQTDGAVCYGRIGVSAQAFGSVCQWAIQLLNLLTGNLDAEGGALVPSPAFGYIKPGAGGAGNYGRWHSRVSQLAESCGELPTSVLAEEMLTEGEGQIRALLTVAGNPMLSAPNGKQMEKALGGLDFMVSVDFYINETTCHADIILPPTGPLEHDHYDIAFLRLAVRNTTRYNAPVFTAPADSRHDWQILNALTTRLASLNGQADYQALPAPHELIDLGIQYGEYGASTEHPLKLSLDVIKQYPHGMDLGPLLPSLKERLCTRDGMIELAPDMLLNDLPRLLASAGQIADDQLLLIGRRHVRSNNSWMHNSHRLVKGKPRWQLLMHPNDMAARALVDGQSVGITSAVGEVTTLVVSSEEVMPGVVSLPHGWGHQSSNVKLSIASKQQGVNCNDLVDQRAMDVLSGTAVFNGVPVTVA